MQLKILVVIMIILVSNFIPSNILQASYTEVLDHKGGRLKHDLSTIRVVEATVYHNVHWQTDSTPNITADGTDLREIDITKYRILAISRDLLNKFPFGSRVSISGTEIYDGIWYVHDIMNKRYSKTIDFLIPTKSVCDKWEDVYIELNEQNKVVVECIHCESYPGALVEFPR